MRTVFEILPASFDAENCSLLCEVSNEGFSYCVKDEETNSFLGIGIYHYDKSKPLIGLPIALQIIFHQNEILSKNFRKVGVVYSFPQSVLIPFSLYEREKNPVIMNMMFGDLHENEILLTDVITDQSMYNCYRLPAATCEVIQSQFPNAVTDHQYSLLLKNINRQAEQLSVIFYSHKIIIYLVKEGKIQLINSFPYSTPEDVSYILLNIRQQFKIENIHLKISGLIEENSALFKEIYKYFNDIELTALPEGSHYSEEITKFPSHYFGYIFALDPCAS